MLEPNAAAAGEVVELGAAPVKLRLPAFGLDVLLLLRCFSLRLPDFGLCIFVPPPLPVAAVPP